MVNETKDRIKVEDYIYIPALLLWVVYPIVFWTLVFKYLF